MTMREKLIEAAALAWTRHFHAAQRHRPDFETWTLSEARFHKERCTPVVDAILTTLAEPDEGVTSALVAAVRQQVAWISPSEDDGAPASEVHFVDAGSIDVEDIKVAMIDHIRSAR